MGEILLVLLPAMVLVALIWGLSTALSPRDSGMSDAEKYQHDLAERSAEHYAAQVRAATAARARLDANTRPARTTTNHPPPGDALRPGPRQEVHRSALEMESLVIPAFILVVVAAGVALAARAISRRRRLPQRPARPPPVDPVELARTAAAKLTEDQHRRLYALIAQGQAMAAIKLYYEATGAGLRAVRDAVGALAAHPQPYRTPGAAEAARRPTTTIRPSASPTATGPSPARVT